MNALSFVNNYTSDSVHPPIEELLLLFNCLYFDSKLETVTIEWSNRMTLCAGLCYYIPRLKICKIKLSECLLKYRPISDLINTILHEMIHAYLFIYDNEKTREGHGPKFQQWMNEINLKAGTSITVFHTFQEEVNVYKKHIWKCNGPCQFRSPFYGVVKRSMNRPPQTADWWFKDHQVSCGGTFSKISSPEDDKKPLPLEKNTMTSSKQLKLIDFWESDDQVIQNPRILSFVIDKPVKSTKWPCTSTRTSVSESNPPFYPSHWIRTDNTALGPNKEMQLDVMDISDDILSLPKPWNSTIFVFKSRLSFKLLLDHHESRFVSCPICALDNICEDEINDHLDRCLIQKNIESQKPLDFPESRIIIKID